MLEGSFGAGDQSMSEEAPAAADDDSAASSSSTQPWLPVHFASRSPGSRVFPSAVVHEDSLYIFGGHDGGVYRNDLLVFNLETRVWLLDQEVSGGGPSPRDAHAAVVHDEWMYVFGGYDSKRYLNDFHRYHFESSTWSTVTYSGGAPSPRGGHTAVVHADEMLVFGGCDGWNYFNDLFKFSFGSEQWVPVRVTGTAPGARSAPATVIHEGQAMMYVFGGYDGGRSLNDLFRFDFTSSEWSQVSMLDPPPPRACPRFFRRVPSPRHLLGAHGPAPNPPPPLHAQMPSSSSLVGARLWPAAVPARRTHGGRAREHSVLIRRQERSLTLQRPPLILLRDVSLGADQGGRQRPGAALRAHVRRVRELPLCLWRV
jgi:hypothetical protein